MNKWADIDDSDFLTKGECDLDEDFKVVCDFPTQKKEPPDIITLDDDDPMEEPVERKEEEKRPEETILEEPDPFCKKKFLRTRRRRKPILISLDEDEGCSTNSDSPSSISTPSSSTITESGFNETGETFLDAKSLEASMVTGFRKLAEFLQRKDVEEAAEPLFPAPFVPTKGDYNLYFDAVSREMDRLHPGERERSQDDINVRYSLIEADLQEHITKKSFKKLKKKLKRDATEEPAKKKRKYKKHVEMDEEEEAAGVAEAMETEEEPELEPAVAAVVEPMDEEGSSDAPLEEDVGAPLITEATPTTAVAKSQVSPVRESTELPEATLAPVCAVTATVVAPEPVAAEDPLPVDHMTPDETHSAYDDSDLESFEIETITDFNSDNEMLTDPEMEQDDEEEAMEVQTAKEISEESPAGSSPSEQVLHESVDSVAVAVSKPTEPEHHVERNGIVKHHASSSKELIPSVEAGSVVVSERIGAEPDNEGCSTRSTLGSELVPQNVDPVAADVPLMPEEESNEASDSERSAQCELEEPDFNFDPEEEDSAVPMSSERERGSFQDQGGASPCSTQDSDSCTSVSAMVSSASSSASPESRMDGLPFFLDEIEAPQGWKQLHLSTKKHPDDTPVDLWDNIMENEELVKKARELDDATGVLRPINHRMIRRIYNNITTDGGRDRDDLSTIPPAFRIRKGDRALERVERNTPPPVGEKKEQKEPSLEGGDVEEDDEMFEMEPEDDDAMFEMEPENELEEGEVVSSEEEREKKEAEKEEKPLEEVPVQAAEPTKASEAPDPVSDDDDDLEIVFEKPPTLPPPPPPMVILDDDDDDIEVLDAKETEQERIPEAQSAPSAPISASSSSYEVLDTCGDEETETRSPDAEPAVGEKAKDTDISMEDLEEVDDTEKEGDKKAEEAAPEPTVAPVVQEPPKRREVTWKLVGVTKRSPTGISKLFAKFSIAAPKDGEPRRLKRVYESKDAYIIPLHAPIANTKHKIDLSSNTMFGVVLDDVPIAVEPKSLPLPVLPPIGMGKTGKKRKADAKKKKQTMHELMGVDMSYAQHKKYENQGLTIHEQWELNERDVVSRREEELNEKGVILEYAGIPINLYTFPYDPYAGLAWPIFQPTDGVPISEQKERMMDQADVRNQVTNLSQCNYVTKKEFLCDYKAGTWDDGYEDGRRCRNKEDMKRKGRFNFRVGYMRKINNEDLEEAKRRDLEKQQKEEEMRRKAKEEWEKEREASQKTNDAPQEGERLTHKEIFCRDGRMDSYVNKSLIDNYSPVSRRYGGLRKASTLPFEWFNIQPEFYIPVNDRRNFLCEYVNFYNEETVREFELILDECNGKVSVDRLVCQWQIPVIMANYVLQKECTAQIRLMEDDCWEAKMRLSDIKRVLPAGTTVRLADVKRFAKLTEWENKYWTFIWDNLCSIYRAMPPVAMMMDDLRDPVDRVFKQMAPASHRETFYKHYERQRDNFVTSQREDVLMEHPQDEEGFYDPRPLFETGPAYFNNRPQFQNQGPPHYGNPYFREEQQHYSDFRYFDSRHW